MTLKRFDGAVYVDLTTRKRFDGASWIDMTVAKRFDGAVWVDIPLGGGGAISATVSHGEVFGEEVLVGAGQPVFTTVVSQAPATVTVTPTGGTGPYTHSWAVVSGSSGTSAINPTSATTGFEALLGRNQSTSAYLRDTVTDSLSATTYVDVLVHLQYIYESGGGEIPP